MILDRTIPAHSVLIPPQLAQGVAYALERMLTEELRYNDRRPPESLLNLLAELEKAAESHAAQIRPKAPPTPEPLPLVREVPVAEAAAIFGISDRAVRKRVAHGHLYARKVCGKWLVSVPIEPTETAA